MTLEELLQAAEGGDVDAMIKLGDTLYEMQGTGNLPEGFGNGLDWYTRAAENGSLVGVIKTMMFHHNIAVTAKASNYWRLVEESGEESLKYASVVLSVTGLAEKYRTMAHEIANTARYHLALACFYQDDDVPACISYLREMDSQEPLMSSILLGICLLQTHHEDEAYKYLDLLRGNRDKILPKPAASGEESLVGLAFFYLSTIYRVSKRDMETAFSVLEEGLRSVDDQDAQELLRKEMGRYHKGLFGGYRYQ